jgi:hypothetical protein
MFFVHFIAVLIAPHHHVLAHIVAGIVPLDSLVRVLLSSSEFEPRLTSDDVRVLLAGFQVYPSLNHNNSTVGLHPPPPIFSRAILCEEVARLTCVQPYVHVHSFSHGGGEKVVDWTSIMSSLLQVKIVV